MRGTDRNVHGGGGRNSAARLPVAEERSEYCGSDFSELHDAGYDDLGQWIDVPSGGDEHSGNGNERNRDADGESGSGGADDHRADSESDGNSGTDGDVHGGGGRNSAARLPVAEERSEYCGSDFSKLHDAGYDGLGQWIDVRCGGDEHGRNGNERNRDTDGECGSGGTDDQHAASESDGNRGTDSNVHGGGGRNSAARLPVAEERREYCRSGFSEVQDARYDGLGQWIDD